MTQGHDRKRAQRSSASEVAFWLRLAGGLCVVMAAMAGQAQDASARIAAIAENYFDERLRLDPIEASLIGDARHEGDLVITIAPEQQRLRTALYLRVEKALARIERKNLRPADAVTYDLLRYETASRLALERLPLPLMPVDHMESLPVLLANWASGQGEQALRTSTNYHHFLTRIDRLPEWVDQAITNMKQGMQRGIVQPRPLIERALPQIVALSRLPAEANPFFRPVSNFPEVIGEEDREQLAAAYREAVERRIAPAMARLADFLAHEYLPAGRTSAGFGDLPGGKAWYATLVRYHTTTRLTPEQIHRMGLTEVSRIREEIANLAGSLSYSDDRQRLLEWANKDARFRPFRSESEILDAYRRLDARIVPELAKLFGRRPRQMLEIRAEPELTQSTASDHYSLPAQDGSRPGIFWAVIGDPASYNSTRMTALYLHEGQPGHHFHLALQQELDLPRFRRFGWITAYGEGWALYAESLGDLLGVYKDPAARLGRLQMELMRAIRLVVDTGIHRYSWSREKAIRYVMEMQGIDEDEALRAVERYMAFPGQALAYKVGERKLLELRQRARQRLGSRFRLADFHDHVLADGAMPLNLLEAKIDHWLASER